MATTRNQPFARQGVAATLLILGGWLADGRADDVPATRIRRTAAQTAGSPFDWNEISPTPSAQDNESEPATGEGGSELATAQEEQDDAAETLLSLNRLFDQKENGISVSGSWTYGSSVVLSGGINRGATAGRNLLELILSADTEKLFHRDWKGGDFTLKYQHYRGENGSNDTGDFMMYDNIDNPFALSQLAVVYFEQKLFNDRLRIKIGKVDANSEFNVTESNTPKFTEYFLNSSQGNLPTLAATMPTYPDAATSINVFMKPTEDLEFGFGLYDGRLAKGIHTGSRGFDFGGPYVMYGQVGYKLGDRRPTRVGLGVWRHTDNAFAKLDGSGVQSGQNGLYLNIDKVLWRENPEDDKDNQGVHFDFSWGIGDRDVNPFPQSWTAGLDWTGMLPSRDKDIIGIGIAQGFFSDRDPTRSRDSETQVELFYLAKVNENFTVQPDIAYIRHPGGAAFVRDAWVATLRVIFDF